MRNRLRPGLTFWFPALVQPEDHIEALANGGAARHHR